MTIGISAPPSNKLVFNVDGKAWAVTAIGYLIWGPNYAVLEKNLRVL